jgi:hypothetical protein
MHCTPTSAIWNTPFGQRSSGIPSLTAPPRMRRLVINRSYDLCRSWEVSRDGTVQCSPARVTRGFFALVRLRILNNKQPVSVAGRCRLLQWHLHTRWLASVIAHRNITSSVRTSTPRPRSSACTTCSSVARSLGSGRSSIFVFASSPAAHQPRTPASDAMRADLERIGPLHTGVFRLFAHFSEKQLCGAPSRDAVRRSDRLSKHTRISD